MSEKYGNDVQDQHSGSVEVPNVEQWFTDNAENESIQRPLGKGNPMIARGAFGEISIAIRAVPGHWHLVAVKTILQSISNNVPWSADLSSSSGPSPALGREPFHEICALRMLNPHPNIVELLAVYPMFDQDLMSRKTVSLAFSYCPTDLYLTLESRRRSLKPLLPFDIIKRTAMDIFTAIHHCHSNGVLHLDIKPGNFLVSSAGYIQLCDFGLAKPFQINELEEAKEETRGLCTLYYRPPELLLGDSANHPAVDNYSAGLVLAELLTGSPLFQGESVLSQLAILFNVLGTPDKTNWQDAHELPDYGKLQFLPKTPKSLDIVLPRATESPFLSDLLEQLIVLDPSKRLSSKEALLHQWFTCSSTALASRKAMQHFLIPEALQEKILLSNSKKDLSVASKQAFDQAALRRSYLSSLHEWRDDSGRLP